MNENTAARAGSKLRDSMLKAVSPEINAGLTIDEIRYAAKVIRNDATQEHEEAVLSKLEEVIEAYDYVEKRRAKRKKEAEAQEREDEAVELLSRGVVPSALGYLDIINGQAILDGEVIRNDMIFRGGRLLRRSCCQG